MPQSPRDLWSQFMILWPGGELTGPRARFGARADANFDSLRDSLVPFFTRTPKEALGLPPYEILRPTVQLAPVQAEIYAAIADSLRQIVPTSGSMLGRLLRRTGARGGAGRDIRAAARLPLSRGAAGEVPVGP